MWYYIEGENIYERQKQKKNSLNSRRRAADQLAFLPADIWNNLCILAKADGSDSSCRMTLPFRKWSPFGNLCAQSRPTKLLLHQKTGDHRKFASARVVATEKLHQEAAALQERVAQVRPEIQGLASKVKRLEEDCARKSRQLDKLAQTAKDKAAAAQEKKEMIP
ncbi:hypothetical protein HPB52_008871 [Rhipicephalus sanguineus]|uniref:Uncharacterized protein n=1 Tax=Rhipicephalus sanguineus TaxID=34632 RepID=A0A9D4SWT9_RHISA|nr:hypothetical protein HPB52_008871 [Rhipicephalus sanguineus]